MGKRKINERWEEKTERKKPVRFECLIWIFFTSFDCSFFFFIVLYLMRLYYTCNLNFFSLFIGLFFFWWLFPIWFYFWFGWRLFLRTSLIRLLSFRARIVCFLSRQLFCWFILWIFYSHSLRRFSYWNLLFRRCKLRLFLLRISQWNIMFLHFLSFITRSKFLRFFTVIIHYILLIIGIILNAWFFDGILFHILWTFSSFLSWFVFYFLHKFFLMLRQLT